MDVDVRARLQAGFLLLLGFLRFLGGLARHLLVVLAAHDVAWFRRGDWGLGYSGHTELPFPASGTPFSSYFFCSISVANAPTKNRTARPGCPYHARVQTMETR